MDNERVVSKINAYLHETAQGIARWLNEALARCRTPWWQPFVMDNLTETQKQLAESKGFTKLEEFDLSALLRLATKNWRFLQTLIYLPNWKRDAFFAMMKVRNNWAHIGAELPGKDAILDDLESIRLFFVQLDLDQKLIEDIIAFVEEIKTGLVAIKEQETIPDKPIAQDLKSEIKQGDLVTLGSDGSAVGIVMSVEKCGNHTKYLVFVDNAPKVFYDDQVQSQRHREQLIWSDAQTAQSLLSAYQINNPSGRDLYSLNAARIDFVPYQFRPALKLIHSDEPRILIADSVGVGKTIEAGLIIKELSARKELDNILVVCPKPLVAEHKWESEMRRFDEDFVSLDGPTLRQVLSDVHRDDGKWPERYSRAVIPYSLFDEHTYGHDGVKTGRFYGFSDLDPAPHFDLVIIDEAHHIRNGSMEKQKAYEYKCVKYLCDHAEAVVMLTATPLQTSDNDLFTLLNLLRPDLVIDKTTFDLMSRPNAAIGEAVSILRAAKEGYAEAALKKLLSVKETQWGEDVLCSDPAYISAVERLQKPELSREDRVRLIHDVESLHTFNLMLNRTRRRDIEDFCTRHPVTAIAQFTDAQKDLYQSLLEFEHQALLHIHGSEKAIPFMMSTIKRQAASCIFGLAPHMEDIVKRRFDAFADDVDGTASEIEISSEQVALIDGLAKDLINKVRSLPDEDPKFDKLMELVREKNKLVNNKIILFSTFRHTLSYLSRRLAKTNIRFAEVTGSTKDIDRQMLRRRFELPKEDDNALDMLLFTEVGSEGLDYQFCDTMVNYDLPWNPMRIEQRIGRIDRRGQLSESVGIYNILTEGTVDYDIFVRCYERIGVFERNIGECEAILGEIADGLKSIYTASTLTEEERRAKIDQMTDNEVRKMQEIERLENDEQDLFGLNVTEYITSRSIQEAENPWLSSLSLQALVNQYFKKRLGEGTYIVGNGPAKQLCLSADKKALLLEDLRKIPRQSNLARTFFEGYLKSAAVWCPITFDAEEAEKNRHCIFVTPTHPLVKQAASFFANTETIYLSLDYSGDDLPAGSYPFSVYSWNYLGVRPHTRLMVVAENDAIAEALPEIIYQGTSGAIPHDVPSTSWNSLEIKQADLWENEKKAAQGEARLFVDHKLATLTDSFRHQKRSLEQKIGDATEEKIVRMYTSQLATANRKYEAKKAELESQRNRTDIRSTLIANGILVVKKENENG